MRNILNQAGHLEIYPVSGQIETRNLQNLIVSSQSAIPENEL